MQRFMKQNAENNRPLGAERYNDKSVEFSRDGALCLRLQGGRSTQRSLPVAELSGLLSEWRDVWISVHRRCDGSRPNTIHSLQSTISP